MVVNSKFISPNFTAQVIPTEFIVLHYTACSLKSTLDIFLNREKKVCAHFVIDTDGCVYDLGGFLDGPILRGAHAGKSHFEWHGMKYVDFNQFSIGVEMINLNGNLNRYTEEQYIALGELVRHLQRRFPILADSSRIVGHEHIAHWRGKADPGVLFDWSRFLSSVGLKPCEFHSFYACQNEDLKWLKSQGKIQNWSKLSLELETRIGQRNLRD